VLRRVGRPVLKKIMKLASGPPDWRGGGYTEVVEIEQSAFRSEYHALGNATGC
jgi:hypothetical protein